MKKYISKFWSNSKGSVSLFFIIIVAIVFFFNAILIDYVRIMAAEQQTEYAIQSATRSAMAAFDSDLKDAYGLFGIDEGELDSFETILKENLESELAEGDDSFRFLDINYIDSNPTLEKARSLANPDILEHQILEEMKYKAPVEITKGLIEKITFLSAAMKESSTFVETASEIVDDFNEREDKLDDLEDQLDNPSNSYEDLKKVIVGTAEEGSYPKANNFAEFVNGFESYETTEDEIDTLKDTINNNNTKIDNFKSRLETLEKRLEDEEDIYKELEKEFEEYDFDEKIDVYIEMSQKKFEKLNLDKEEKEFLEDLRGTNKIIEETEEEIDEIKREKKKLEKENETMDDLIEQMTDDAEDYEEAVEELLSDMQTDIDNVITELTSMIEKIDKSLELNEQIEEVIEENRANAKDNYDDAIDIGKETGAPPEADSGSLDDAMEDISKATDSLDDYVYDEEFFKKTKEHLEKALEHIGNIGGHFTTVDKTEIIENNKDNLSSLLDLMQKEMIEADDALNDAGVYFKDTLKEMREKFKDPEAERTDEEQKEYEKEKEEESETNNDEMKDLTEEIESMIGDIENEEIIYGDLSDLLVEISGYLEELDSDMNFDGKPNDSAKSAMKLADMLFKGIGDMLINMRDELYVNEYILYYFESINPSSITDYEDFKFENREVEYILYGIHEPGANYSAALAQLSALRFALNFISAFTDERVRLAGHPLAVFVAALAYALGNTVTDMQQITLGKSEEVDLLWNVTNNFSLTYKEYIRLFLFMNKGGEDRLKRVATVIGYHNANLKDRQTYLTGTVETSIQLWFLPEAMSALGLTGIIDGEVNGSEYKFKKEAVFSY